MERTRLAALDPPRANARKVGLGRLRLKVPKDLFLAEQGACSACIVGHEDGGGSRDIAGQTLQHRTDFRLAFDREGKSPLQSFRGDGDNPLLDDIAGMLDVRNERKNLR